MEFGRINNAVTAGLNTYHSIKNYQQQQQDRKLAEEDRQFQRQRIEAADRRAEENHALGLAQAAQGQQLNNLNIESKKLSLEDEYLRKLDSDRIRAEQQNERQIGLIIKQLNTSDRIGEDGEISEDEKLFLQQNPHLDINYLSSPEFKNAAITFKKVASGSLDYNSPEALSAFSVLAPEIINQSSATVNGIRQIHQGSDPDSLIIGLNTAESDREVPLTRSRSSADRDPIKQFKKDSLIRNLSNRVILSEIAQTQAGRDHLRAEWAAIQERNKKADPSRKSGDLPKDYQFAKLIQQEYAQKNQFIDLDEALEISKLAVGNPAAYVSDYVESATKAQSDLFIRPGSEGYKTRQELQEEALKSYEEITNKVYRRNPESIQSSENNNTQSEALSDQNSQQSTGQKVYSQKEATELLNKNLEALIDKALQNPANKNLTRDQIRDSILRSRSGTK